MPNAEDLSKYFEILSVVLFALLAIRLAVLGLWRSYPIFFCYVILRIPHGIWPLLLDVHSNRYLHVWLYTEPVFYLFHILLVAELCRLILVGHPGIYTLMKWAMIGGVTLAVAISVLSLLPHLSPKTALTSKAAMTEFAGQRGVDFGLGMFLLLMMAFMSRYPLRLGRNVLVHASIYTFFFFAQALGVFVHTIFGLARGEQLNLVMTIMSCGCLVAWLLLLSRRGEQVQAAFPTYSAGREDQILEQLNALNASLTRAGKEVSATSRRHPDDD